MTALIDLFIINAAAIIAFGFRHFYGDLIVKQPPLLYWEKYLLVLLLLNLTYPIIFWLLGLYDKRQKRALLEEFFLIFGVFSTSIAILIIFLFLGRLWWISRIVLFVFWGLAILLLCLSRLFNRPQSQAVPVDTAVLKAELLQKKAGLPASSDKLSIIIVCTDELSKLKSLLKSIWAADLSLPKEIMVVNNYSNDGTSEFLAQNHREVRVVNNPSRSGYSQSVNNGLKVASGRYCLILNPDIIVIPGALELMVDYLQKNARVGLAGCKLLNFDGTLQFSVRRFLDLRTYLYRFTPLRSLLAGSQIERYYLMQDWDHNDSRLVDWVLGGCMLVRRAAFEQVGLMDEQFFLYFDDVDWCFRMWEKGWQVAYVAEAAMIHKHERTSVNKLFDRAMREHFKSLFKFIRKHGFRLPQNCPSSLE